MSGYYMDRLPVPPRWFRRSQDRKWAKVVGGKAHLEIHKAFWAIANGILTEPELNELRRLDSDLNFMQKLSEWRSGDQSFEKTRA